DAHSTSCAFAATLTSAATPAEPSAFITTTDQSPLCGFQTRSCTPLPDAEASQKVRDAGGVTERVPRRLTYVASNGSRSTSDTSACATPARYRVTSSLRPTPTKMRRPSAGSTRIRNLSNTQSGTSPATSTFAVASALVSVA